jgi:hypothetical protein
MGRGRGAGVHGHGGMDHAHGPRTRTGPHGPRATIRGERGKGHGARAAGPGLGGTSGLEGGGIYQGMEPATGGAIARKTGARGGGLNH